MTRQLRVALIGRPNVGKSTLFNRMAGKSLSLVQNQPGVTRDWQETQVHWGGLSFYLLDTPGLSEKTTCLPKDVWQHTWHTLKQVDCFLFMFDGREGLIPEDHALALQVRKIGRPVIVLANKCEGRQAFYDAWDAYQLGLGSPLPISAAHGQGLEDLAQALSERISYACEQTLESSEEKPLRIGVVGRPNVGKSTLINCLLGEERMLTGPEAGLTRDAVEIPWSYQGRRLELIDTAGLRKRAKIEATLEKMSVKETFRTIDFSQIVVVVMDALQAFERQDCLIAARVIKEGRGLILALNKWDAVKNAQKAMGQLEKQVGSVLPQVKGIPLVAVSALQKSGMRRLMRTVFETEKKWQTRISTGQLNRFLEQMIQKHQPPLVQGRRIKLKYMTQIKTGPPTFVVFGSQTSALPLAYQGYLLNGLRRTFHLGGVPLRLLLRCPDNPFVH